MTRVACAFLDRGVQKSPAVRDVLVTASTRGGYRGFAEQRFARSAVWLMTAGALVELRRLVDDRLGGEVELVAEGAQLRVLAREAVGMRLRICQLMTRVAGCGGDWTV